MMKMTYNELLIVENFLTKYEKTMEFEEIKAIVKMIYELYEQNISCPQMIYEQNIGRPHSTINIINNQTSEKTDNYDRPDAIDFIHKRCGIDKDIIEKILELDDEYMIQIGLEQIVKGEQIP